MEYLLQTIVIPVSDVDVAKSFYGHTLGFSVDVDHKVNDEFRVVQVTPPGSACSITFGIGVTKVEPGTYEGMHLVVTDIEQAHADLVGRGVDVSEPFHFGPNGQNPGLDPERRNYGTYLSFQDPDGNGWLVQEVGYSTG